jgi:hypothetical protein
MERTPEQQRDDRRAGFGCSAGLLVMAVLAVWGGLTLLDDSGTRAQARILSCEMGHYRTGGAKCRGMWRIDGAFVQGQVAGASRGDIGQRLEVLTEPGSDSAEVVRGRRGAGITVLALAALLAVCGVAIGRGVWRSRPG